MLRSSPDADPSRPDAKASLPTNRIRSLSIGVLAQAAGTNVETVRFYEKSGLLPAPPRTQKNYRSYDASHLNRLNFIRRARELGFSLDQVRTLLDLSDNKSHSCAAVDAIATEHLAAVKQKIADLISLEAELARMLAQCSSGKIADCRIIESLAPK